jgi:hypothetical protein
MYNSYAATHILWEQNNAKSLQYSGEYLMMKDERKEDNIHILLQ